MSDLHGVQRLAEHLLLQEKLGLVAHLHLRLAAVLEVAESANGLVDRSTSAVARLERSGIGGLVHVEVAHVLGLVVLRRLLLGVVLGLSPVALEVARLAPAMALAATALEVRLLTVVLVGRVLAGSWEREGRPTTASTSTAASYSHALTAAVTTSSTTGGSSVVGSAVSTGTGITVGAALSRARNGELEARSLSLRFGLFGGLLRVGESK